MIDCIVIGGGPAGLSAGVNLAQRGKIALVLSSSESLLAKAEKVDNYLGMQDVTGAEMMAQFKAHAVRLGVELRHGRAGNVMPFDGQFMVNADGDILESKTVILATGIAKAKPVAGESELLGRGVSYCATCDGMLYRGRKVAVWGLSLDAPLEANFLCSIGCEVLYISAKRPDMLLEEISYIKGRVDAILGESFVTGVSVSGEIHPVEGVFLLRPAAPPDALLPGLTALDGTVPINALCETNIPGVFAAGDLTGKPLQVAKAVGEGLNAALSAAEYIDKQIK